MWKNHLVVALRNLWKGRLYSFVNIAGLAVGLAACLLIFSYVRQELGYDRWIPDYERLYLVETTFALTPGNEVRIPSAPNPAKTVFEDEIAAIEKAARFGYSKVVLLKDKAPLRLAIFEADPDYFDLVRMPFRAGRAAKALARPDALVLTESAARKLFGDAPAVGRTVPTADGKTRVVTAVVADLPRTTSFPFEALVPIDETGLDPAASLMAASWGFVSRQLFLRLDPGADPDAVEALMADVARPHIEATFANRPGVGKNPMTLRLMPIADYHLKSKGLGTGGRAPNDLESILAFATIGVIILGMAVFNYTNIALARSLKRAREVALRKAVGAGRRTIILQFLGESLLVTTFALLLGMVLAILAQPYLEPVFGSEVVLDPWSEPAPLLIAFGLSLLAGVAGGMYPAIVAAGYRPARLLHGGAAPAIGGRLRTALVVLQFATAIALVVSTAIIYRQILFARSAEIGFEDETVYLVGGFKKEDAPRLAAFEAEVRRLPGVVETAWAVAAPGDRTIATSGMTPVDGGEPVGVERYTVSLSYFDALEIPALHGHTFHRGHRGDLMQGPVGGERHGAVVLNEMAARRLGFATPADAVGAHIGERRQLEVVGVVPDLHFRSFREPVRPQVFFAEDDQALDSPLWFVHRLLVRFDPTARDAVRAALEGKIAEMFAHHGTPVSVTPLDRQIAALYDQERRRAHALAAASVLAILISGLGLFGLAAIAAERRTREVGIRKVFGARVPDILRLATAEFTRPVLLANLIAWPVAWYVMRRWLDGFAYRIDLEFWPFLAAGAGALLVALLTVSGHALAAARTHPAIALREE